MSSPPSHVRSGLTAEQGGPDGPEGAPEEAEAVSPGPAYAGPPLVVAVTGAASGVGERLTARLAAAPGVRRVLAIDERRGAVTGVQ